jgi:hypothetical protein
VDVIYLIYFRCRLWIIVARMATVDGVWIGNRGLLDPNTVHSITAYTLCNSQQLSLSSGLSLIQLELNAATTAINHSVSVSQESAVYVTWATIIVSLIGVN